MTMLPGRVFADRLREERVRAGFSQAALAERLTEVLSQAIDASAITRIEKHERTVKLDEAVMIAEVLEVPLTTLLRGRETVDEKVADLRRSLREAKWRASNAEEELQKAQDEMAYIRRSIAELEALRG